MYKLIPSYFSKILLILCFFAILGASVCWAGPPAAYPTPPISERSLFYLQRSSNSNTVVYDANLQSNGQLNPKKPVDVYWLRYNTNGERRKLNFAERNFAYGLSFDTLNNNRYLINLMAYSDRDIKIFIDQKGKPVAHTEIAGKASHLTRIYIDVSGSGFWTSVNYIELTGVDLMSGKEITEKFDPDD